jgi:hypothetical protein
VKFHAEGSMMNGDARGTGQDQDSSGSKGPFDAVPQPWCFANDLASDVHLAARTMNLPAFQPAEQGGRRHGEASECG